MFGKLFNCPIANKRQNKPFKLLLLLCSWFFFFLFSLNFCENHLMANAEQKNFSVFPLFYARILKNQTKNP